MIRNQAKITIDNPTGNGYLVVTGLQPIIRMLLVLWLLIILRKGGYGLRMQTLSLCYIACQ